MSVRILVGAAREKLREMADESVHCVVTSPPYWGLRAYGGDSGMIGLEETFDEHLVNLVAVFREVRRVLRKDGTLWLNYGDAYEANRSYQVKDNKHCGVGNTSGSRVLPGLKPKDLMLMPARVAMALQADGADVGAVRAIERAEQAILDAYEGERPPDRVLVVLEGLRVEYAQAKGDSWWLRSEIVWHKPNPMPESVRDRPTSAHEKLFLLTKAARYFYDAEAVRVASDGWHGKVRPTLAPEDAERQSGNDRNEQPSANLRNVWKIATAPYKGAHFATFPPKLVEPCIKAGTSEKGCCSECGAPWNRVVERTAMEIRRSERTHDLGRTRSSGTMTKAPTSETTGWAPTCEHDTDPIPCTVLDPFGGAGTVGLVTEALGRDSTLIEISGKYAKMSRNRIIDNAPLFAKVTVE